MPSPRRRYRKRADERREKLIKHAKIFVVRLIVSLILLFAVLVMKFIVPNSTVAISSAINSNIDVQSIQKSVTDLILQYSTAPPSVEPEDTIETSN